MKKWLVGSGVAVVCIILILVCIGSIRKPIIPFQVEKIELKTYDHRDYGNAELTNEEEKKLIKLYNQAWYAGDVTGEPCCDSYGFKVYYHNDSTLYVGEGTGSKMIVRSRPGAPFYIKSQELVDYICELAEKYDLPMD